MNTTLRISTTDTAKIIRTHLKETFPATKFSVRSEKYTGGSSIWISWVDGPTRNEVDLIAKMYEGATFDGMTDMKDYKTSFLVLDGDDFPTEVKFGSDFVFTDRRESVKANA